MTKRELIDQILSENQTAEPGFLAQFSDEQLHEYLTHLKWLKQPRLRGDASRFDRYFRNCPTVVSPPAPWRTAGEAVPAAPRRGVDRESLDLSAHPVDSAVEAPEPPPPPAPVEAAPAPVSLPPPTPYAEFDAPLPADIEALEEMQLSLRERSVLTAASEEVGEEEEPPAEQDPRSQPNPPAAPPPISDTATDEQTWLF